MILLTLWKILSISADDSTLCCDIPHPSDSYAAASSLSSDLDQITNWSSTWNTVCPSLLRNPIHSRSLTKRTRLQTSHLLSQQPSQSGSITQSWFSLSAMISLGQATFQSWSPKPEADKASSIMQSPSLAHLSSYPPTRLSSVA